MSSSPYSEKSKSSLASMSVQEEVASTEHRTGHSHQGVLGGNWAWGVVLFIILVVILIIIFAAWQPKWLLRNRKGKGGRDDSDDCRTKCVDWVRVLLAAIVVAIVLLILFLLLRGIVNSWNCWGTTY